MSPLREEEAAGALCARLNLFSATVWISLFMADASKMSTIVMPSICWTRLVAPVQGSPVPCFILLHSPRCSSHFIMSMILVHMTGSLRLDASSYLFQRCSCCSWSACSSCSFISFLHAVTSAKHSSSVNAMGLSIPALNANQNTFLPESFPFSCHATRFTYALHLMSVSLIGWLNGRGGLMIFWHPHLPPPCCILLLCTSKPSNCSWLVD